MYLLYYDLCCWSTFPTETDKCLTEVRETNDRFPQNLYLDESMPEGQMKEIVNDQNQHMSFNVQASVWSRHTRR